MSQNPFDPTFDALPTVLPIFPLSGALLLPGGRLPLNIFEPRYLAMVRDVLGGDRMIGMIQPTPISVDPIFGAPLTQTPSVYAMGCAGRIISFSETPDGRFLITLAGVCRFRIGEEIEGRHGFRRIAPDWTDFAADLATPPESLGLDRDSFHRQLEAYFDQNGIRTDWDALHSAPDHVLVTCLSMICPFRPTEKQALLEASDLKARANMLLALVGMAVHDSSGEKPHPTLQ